MYDIKHKTLKLKSIVDKNSTTLFAKQIVMTLVSAGVVLGTVIIMYIISMLLYKGVASQEQYSTFIVSTMGVNTNGIVQILFSIGIAVLFLNIGFCIGTISRNLLFTVLAVVGYTLLIPVLGEYDLKNVISAIGNKVFEFTGTFQLFTPSGVVTSMHYIIWGVFIIALISLTYFISNNRSKYV